MLLPTCFHYMHIGCSKMAWMCQIRLDYHSDCYSFELLVDDSLNSRRSEAGVRMDCHRWNVPQLTDGSHFQREKYFIEGKHTQEIKELELYK